MDRKKWVVWSGLVFIALVATVLFYCPWAGVFEDPALPALNGIDAMRAYYEPREGDFRFAVPREKWPEILASLTPAEKDDPCKWQAIGTLVITKHNGRQIAVDLYTLDKPPGAFSIRTPWRKVYYRGGDSVKLDAALRAAYEASREQ